MANIKDSITELIGNTPMVEFHRLREKLGLEARIVGKLEYFNPGGSSKDRIALAMIEGAEREGKIKNGSVIVEFTSGNTGIGLAEVAAAKGYGCKIAVQPGTSEERVKLVQAYGAETFEPYIGKDVMESLADVDRVAAETPGGWVPTQFHNLNNGGAHYATTGPEIYRDTDGKVDIYVAGVGTGGTASGTSEFLKKVKPEIYTVAVQPSPESVATPEKSVEEMTGIHKFTEIDPSFVPGNVHIDAFDEIYDVQTEEALSALQELARTEGVLMGYSGGAALYAAIKLARRPENKDKLIVFIVPDNGERYLSQDIYSKRSSQDRVVL